MPLAFSPDAQKKIAETRSRYPNAQAACLPLLHIAQEEFGYISDEAIDLVAATLALPPAHVWGVVTFYTMYHRHPTGKHVVMVCTNVACMLKGGYDVLAALEKSTGCKAGETSPDGEFTVVEEECLAACADAPMMISGEKYFLRLTPEAAVRALDEIKRLPPDHGHA
ncbi:MAG TPA: NAD(P)H-dependent oxidoreductase subunit E [Polyangia bacterium]|nr:NAD(P)H-dependent oxidoreductase subunit E [Polyangia bacterium]